MTNTDLISLEERARTYLDRAKMLRAEDQTEWLQAIETGRRNLWSNQRVADRNITKALDLEPKVNAQLNRAIAFRDYLKSRMQHERPNVGSGELVRYHR